LNRLSDLIFVGGAKIDGLPDAVSGQQPATLAQLQGAVEGIAWKDDVSAASTANVNLAAPGTAMDGITLTNPMRVLLKNQTAAAENGIYIWTASGAALTRSLDMNSSAEFNSAIVPVAQGTTNAGTQWRQTAVNPTVGTTSIVFTAFGSSAPPASETTAGIAEIATQAETDAGTDDLRMVTPLKLKTAAFVPKKYAADVGDGTNVVYVLTHNLGTRDITVGVHRSVTPWDGVECDWEATSVNTATLRFASIPTSAQYRCAIIG
jgi:hypothetical protein